MDHQDGHGPSCWSCRPPCTQSSAGSLRGRRESNGRGWRSTRGCCDLSRGWDHTSQTQACLLETILICWPLMWICWGFSPNLRQNWKSVSGSCYLTLACTSDRTYLICSTVELLFLSDVMLFHPSRGWILIRTFLTEDDSLRSAECPLLLQKILQTVGPISTLLLVIPQNVLQIFNSKLMSWTQTPGLQQQFLLLQYSCNDCVLLCLWPLTRSFHLPWVCVNCTNLRQNYWTHYLGFLPEVGRHQV